ncbi:hypothetical protein GCM10022402_16510 [Salinactinospora qingdaonensis]|uniref:Uncharacterized protein n=1 Tax=Salinactinospora qingdaonensis TaxID=702744 RepID=A0ABP7FGN5_9ACTN
MGRFFPKIELKLAGGGKRKLKLGIFPEEMKKKEGELGEIASLLGFEKKESRFLGDDWWVK